MKLVNLFKHYPVFFEEEIIGQVLKTKTGSGLYLVMGTVDFQSDLSGW